MLDKQVKKIQQILKAVFETYPERTKTVSAGLEPNHAQDTLGWVLKLNPRASVALQIAALTHDIDRIVSKWRGYGSYHQGNIADYQAYKADHARRSASFIVDKMSKRNYPKDLIERVKFLISHHDDQVAEDPEIQLLQAADALSFFSVFSKESYEVLGSDIRLKIKFSLNKIPSAQRSYLEKIKMPSKVRKILKEIQNDKS